MVTNVGRTRSSRGRGQKHWHRRNLPLANSQKMTQNVDGGTNHRVFKGMSRGGVGCSFFLRRSRSNKTAGKSVHHRHRGSASFFCGRRGLHIATRSRGSHAFALIPKDEFCSIPKHCPAYLGLNANAKGSIPSASICAVRTHA